MHKPATYIYVLFNSFEPIVIGEDGDEADEYSVGDVIPYESHSLMENF